MAGDSKSFGRFHFVGRGVFVTLVVGAASVRKAVFRATGRSFSCSFEGREAPTSAPTTKTPVPTTVNRRSTRAEATWRAPTFKIMAKTVDCAALGASRQHREATSHPSRQVGAGTYHWCGSKRWSRAGQCDSKTAQVRRVHSVKKQRQQLALPATRHEHGRERACHTPVDPASSWGARCRR